MYLISSRAGFHVGRDVSGDFGVGSSPVVFRLGRSPVVFGLGRNPVVLRRSATGERGSQTRGYCSVERVLGRQCVVGSRLHSTLTSFGSGDCIVLVRIGNPLCTGVALIDRFVEQCDRGSEVISGFSSYHAYPCTWRRKRPSDGSYRAGSH
ncbi:MAG: hypothetical protein ACR2P2_20690 [Nakamurella sp.]